MKRRWPFILGIGLLAFAGLAAAAVVAGLALLSPPDAHQPYPNARLVSARTVRDAAGWRTIRVYHSSGTVGTVASWYRRAEGVPRLGDEVGGCAENLALAPAPRWPVPRLALSRRTVVRYCPDGGGTTITTDTRFYWRYVEPQRR